MAVPDSLARKLSPGAVLTSPAELAVYSYDGALERARPDAVVLARSAEDVARTVAWCAQEGIPFTARGAGTNLSGGCVPLKGGVVLSTARMDRVLEVQAAAGVALVEPGVVNLGLQKQLEPLGLFYAPDPASYRVCTLGGNIAENAGGPRCLKYGTTTNHVLALEAVMPDGSLVRFSLEDGGPELSSLLVGSEGTLGVVTRAWLKILPAPETILTLLAGFDSLEGAMACVSEMIARGIVPRVLEAMDRVTVESVEAYKPAGYPKTEAVLLIELDGPRAKGLAPADEVEALCRRHGSREFRSATDPAERERLWEGRRGAYAAMARLAPNVLVEDGVVPRDRLVEIVRRIGAVTAAHGVQAGLLFHAGDGNIHPNIAYDERDPAQTSRVKAAGYDILRACVELGGSLSGEHGIGSDKREAMAWLFSPETLALQRRIKAALDPLGIANPDKVLPTEPAGSRPYLRPQSRELSPAAQRLAERVRTCAAAGREMRVRGAGTRLPMEAAGLKGIEDIGTGELRDIRHADRANGTVTAEAGISVMDLHSRLQREGLHLTVPELRGTLGGLLATKAWPGSRDAILGMRLLLADGTVVQVGGSIVKDVAGYDICRLMLGSWGAFAVILEATLRAYPRPQPRVPCDAHPKPFAAGPWQRRIKAAFDPGNRLNPWLFP